MGCTFEHLNINVASGAKKAGKYGTWNAGGRIARPPIAQASRSRDCSYKEGAESVSEELEATEGLRGIKRLSISKKKNKEEKS